MTRLTPEMISAVPESMASRDARLKKDLGLSMKGLAAMAVGVQEDDIDLTRFKAAVVPVTSGKGVTSGFCPSVSAITEHLGMRSFVTNGTDVAGLAEALAERSDIVFMADDSEFIALNVKTSRYADNTRSTAMAYFTAMKHSLGGVGGQDVLVIGAGRVGSCVVELLVRDGARVKVAEADPARTRAIHSRFPQISVCNDLESCVRQADNFINASPARIPGNWIRQGAVVSSPGMPYSFDAEGEQKMRVLVHDPLQLGVAVMAVWSASYSSGRQLNEALWPQTVEALQ